MSSPFSVLSMFPLLMRPGWQHFLSGWMYASIRLSHCYRRVLTSRVLECTLLSHRRCRLLLRFEYG